jgi:alanyl-tRNA synthetase
MPDCSLKYRYIIFVICFPLQQSRIILITLKTDGNSGQVLLRGGEKVINSERLLQFGETLCTILDGKGSLRGNLFQAKVSKMNQIQKALKAAEDFVELIPLEK